MSRYSAYTHWFILLNKREQEAFTKAFVHLAMKPLSMSERKTMTAFERVWFAGKDFTPDRTFAYFVDMARRHHVRIEFNKKPEEAGRRGEKGAMRRVEWTNPEVNGSYWPASKKDGEKRGVDETVRIKAKYRTRAKLLEMARLGIPELTFSNEQIETMVDRKVQERVREIEPVQAPRVQANKNRRTDSARGYEDAYGIFQRRLIEDGRG